MLAVLLRTSAMIGISSVRRGICFGLALLLIVDQALGLFTCGVIFESKSQSVYLYRQCSDASSVKRKVEKSTLTPGEKIICQTRC